MRFSVLKAKIWLALENGVWVARIQDPEPNRHRLPLKRCIFPITSNTSKRYTLSGMRRCVLGVTYNQFAASCQWLWWIEILTNYLWPLLTPFFIASQAWCEGHPASITVSSLFSIPLQIIFFQHRGSHFVSLKIFYINHLFPKLRLLRNGCRGIKHGQTL